MRQQLRNHKVLDALNQYYHTSTAVFIPLPNVQRLLMKRVVKHVNSLMLSQQRSLVHVEQRQVLTAAQRPRSSSKDAMCLFQF